MKKLFLVIFALLLSLVAACSPNNQDGELSIEQAKQMIDSDEVTVIDVRTQEEYDQGHIKDSMLIPLNELENRIGELDKDQPYLVVCRTGNRSSQAADILENNGFTKVYNLQSGISAWSYPLEK